MNANELADELKLVRCLAGDGQVLDKAATMLRQLQTENEKLKTEIIDIEKNTDYWADKATNPLELTDEEILELWVNKNNLNGAQDIVYFAKAILKKAQEK